MAERTPPSTLPIQMFPQRAMQLAKAHLGIDAELHRNILAHHLQSLLHIGQVGHVLLEHRAEHREAEQPGDIAVFPLAFPVIAGPGSLSAVVLLMGRVEGWTNSVAVLAMLTLCLVLTFGTMLTADRLIERLGKTGADVVGRIFGVLLAALAVQFVLDGVRTAI